MTAMEHEITGPVNLCAPDGTVAPEAIGWAKHPHWTCNLKGRFGRKKKWDYWCFMGEKQLFSVTVAHVDYIGLIGAYMLDYESGHLAECGAVRPFPRTPQMPETTFGTSAAHYGKTHYEQQFGEHGGTILFTAPNCEGRPLTAEIEVSIPSVQETLNVVVPWANDTFQHTSKQLPLACEGEVRWGNDVWKFDRDSAFGVRDFGRGIWPISTRWNWAALSERQGEDTVGVNLGGQWTDGTGATENGLMINGKFFPIADRVVFDCDKRDFSKPWRLHSPGSDAVDLELVPFHDKHSRVNLGLLRTGVHQCFGHFCGTIRAGGHTAELQHALGWAEEHWARW
ncbi:MAG: DUF2804 family protein [Candidatus Hydrogenedens sp.]|nr:DUF2804 family protein [Candidatus Hydrogenedens sp.]